MNDTKKYYWLKLKRDFFKRHDIQIIEAMPNGKDYILFYLKMLVESVDHDGNLRFNDVIPYDESMLSTITNTNVDIARSAMKIFTELKMIEVLNDKTIYMSEVNKMLGTETYWAEQKRKQRIGQCPPDVQRVQQLSNQEIELEKELDIDIDKERGKHPTLDQIKEFHLEKKMTFDVNKFFNYFEEGRWIDSHGNPVINWKQKMISWQNKEKAPKKSHTIEKENKYTEDELEAKLLNKGV
jgi:predicted phage replisome organizer